jgi:hypothetical protein
MASAALVAGTVTTTGGFTALIVRLLRSKKNAEISGLKNAPHKEN